MFTIEFMVRFTKNILTLPVVLLAFALQAEATGDKDSTRTKKPAIDSLLIKVHDVHVDDTLVFDDFDEDEPPKKETKTTTTIIARNDSAGMNQSIENQPQIKSNIIQTTKRNQDILSQGCVAVDSHVHKVKYIRCGVLPTNQLKQVALPEPKKPELQEPWHNVDLTDQIGSIEIQTITRDSQAITKQTSNQPIQVTYYIDGTPIPKIKPLDSLQIRVTQDNSTVSYLGRRTDDMRYFVCDYPPAGVLSPQIPQPLSLNLYPNPAIHPAQPITIKHTGQGMTKIHIRTLGGQLVQALSTSQKTVQIDGLSAGMYLVQIIDEQNKTIAKRLQVL